MNNPRTYQSVFECAFYTLENGSDKERLQVKNELRRIASNIDNRCTHLRQPIFDPPTRLDSVSWVGGMQVECVA